MTSGFRRYRWVLLVKFCSRLVERGAHVVEVAKGVNSLLGFGKQRDDLIKQLCIM